MERIKRNGRMSAMVKIMTASPNRIITLSHFCDLFDAAKSTISEDIELLRGIFEQFGLGEIETVTGAAGGVRYLPRLTPADALATVSDTCRRLADPTRILPGGFLYMGDILANPVLLDQLGTVIASQFYRQEPDFVLTVETRGIPFAMSAARAMGVPLVVARRDQKAYEGPQVTINFISGSTGVMQTMSLARRTVKEGQKALIIDDFMKAGGTMRGMLDLMREFSVQVVGAGVLIQQHNEKRRLDTVRALMTINSIDEEKGAQVIPAAWLG